MMTSSAYAAPSWRRLAKLAVWFCVDTFVTLVPASRRPDRVLVVRLDNIGDFLLWLDAAQRLAAHYRQRGKEAILVAPTAWAAWVRELGIFDRVITFDKKKAGANLLYRFRAELEIRRLGSETAVLPVYSRSWALGDCILRTCGATQRIASQGDPNSGTAIERRFSNHWYTEFIAATPKPLMEIERNAEFLSGLLHADIPARVADLRAITSEDLRASTRATRAMEGPFYVIFPGASAAGKKWPLPAFQEIARRIYHQTGWSGVLCGGPEDVLLSEQFCKTIDIPVRNQAGQTTLAQLTSIIADARLVVSNDTSAVHIAAGVSVPSVCVLGGGHVGRFLPYSVSPSSAPGAPLTVLHPMDCFGCDWHCIYNVPDDQPKPCVARVSIEAVWQAVAAVIASLPAQSVPNEAASAQP